MPFAIFAGNYLNVLRAALFCTLAVVATSRLQALTPLRDPLTLNIGVNCHWQKRCMAAQRSAMRAATNYMERQHPPQWRIQLCNRNASRRSNRMDWMGFYNCVRNSELRPLPARAVRKPSRRAPAAARAIGGSQLGERGL